MFWAAATVFCAVSPTGYLPAVAAGVSFPPAIAVAVSYFSVTCGAALNLAMVRTVLRNSRFVDSRCGPRSRRATLLHGLDAALERYPLRLTVLLRLPYLSNGVINYALALTAVPARWLLLGSAIGLAPGAALFALAGAEVRSLTAMIVAGEPPPPTAVAVFVGTSLCLVIAVAAVVIVARRLAKQEAVATSAASTETAQNAVPTAVVSTVANPDTSAADLPPEWQSLTPLPPTEQATLPQIADASAATLDTGTAAIKGYQQPIAQNL